MSDVEAVSEKIAVIRGQLSSADTEAAAVELRRTKAVQVSCRVLALLGEAVELLVVTEDDGSESTQNMVASSVAAESAYNNASIGIGMLCAGSENPALANAGISAAAAGRSMHDGDEDGHMSVHATASALGAEWTAASEAIRLAQGSLKLVMQYAGAMHGTLHDARVASMEAGLSLNGYVRQITGE